MASIRRETAWVVGERHDDEQCVTELVEVIAHGDHVFLAGQSSEVAVEHQHERSTSVVAEAPGVPFVIDEGDVGEQVALADHGEGAHARSRSASSMPRWKVGYA